MSTQTAPISATNLRTEYQAQPLGIAGVAPRLFWWVNDSRPGAVQRAYRIRAASSESGLASGKADLWDSGKVASSEQTHVTYAGPVLKSRQRVWWDVQLWDGDDVAGAVSKPAWFEAGLLDRSDWQAQCIGSPLEGTGMVGAPSPMLRKAFDLKGPIASARLYITALGVYEASINGKLISKDVFRPGWTDYRKRLNYQTYDVTALLQSGKNVIGAMLGDGWYCGRVGPSDRGMCWGTKPALLAQLEITHADGSVTRIHTDSTWRWQTGAVLNSDMIQGEEYDARREIPGWDTPSFDDSAWQPVVTQPVPNVLIEPSMAPPVRALQEIRPIAEPKQLGGGWEHTSFVYDFGQNLTGVVRLKVRGPAGSTLVIRHAEVIKPNGAIDVSNLRSARCVDHYTLRGDPAGETYTPKFTFHGFRYAEVTVCTAWRFNAAPEKVILTADNATAIVLASDTPDTGTFECDHTLVNKLQSNIRWGMRGNFIEVPTDCPQRDERLGWTGDTQVFASTAAFNADVAGFYTKWMRDLADAQVDNGAVPAIVPKPTGQWDWDGGAGWADATVVVPYSTYLAYGDLRILEESYPAAQRWIAYLTETARDGIRAFPEQPGHKGFGDWLALDAGNNDPGRSATPKDLIATAHFAESLRIIRDMARALGKEADAVAYAKQHQQIVAAFNREYVTPGGRMGAQSQTAYLLALAFDLLPEPVRPAAVELLVGLIQDRNWHLTTGFLGTPLLCPVLTRFGRADVAYRLLLQETYPGWLYPVSIGATTMWERWNSWHPSTGFVDTSMNSLNHYAYGAIGKWLYASVAGLDLDPTSPGYARILIAPKVEKGLTHAKATLETLRGPASSAWKIDNGTFTLHVTVPPNSSARVTLPDGASHDVAAGTHTFSCPFGPK